MTTWGDERSFDGKIQTAINISASVIGLLIIVFLWMGRPLGMNNAFYTFVIAHSVTNTFNISMYGGIYCFATTSLAPYLPNRIAKMMFITIYLKCMNCILRVGMLLNRIHVLAYPRYMMTKYSITTLSYLLFSLFSPCIVLVLISQIHQCLWCHETLYEKIQIYTVYGSAPLCFLILAQLFFYQYKRERGIHTDSEMTRNSQTPMINQLLLISIFHIFEYIFYDVIGSWHVLLTPQPETDWLTFWIMFYANIGVVILETTVVIILTPYLCRVAGQYLGSAFRCPRRRIRPQEMVLTVGNPFISAIA